MSDTELSRCQIRNGIWLENVKNTFYLLNFSNFVVGSPHGVVATVLDCEVVV